MMRRISIVVVVLVAAVMTAAALAAVNVKSFPTATFGSPDAASVTLTGGNFSGLGSVPAEATLTAFGTARYTCTNPQGHASPGQNPVPAAQGSASSPLGNADHNGRGTINDLTASVTAPPTPTSLEAGCGGSGASDKWTVTLIPGSLTATCAELVITQGGNIIFTRTYTSNGIGTAGLTCP
jgi:hypothetical protein